MTVKKVGKMSDWYQINCEKLITEHIYCVFCWKLLMPFKFLVKYSSMLYLTSCLMFVCKSTENGETGQYATTWKLASQMVTCKLSSINLDVIELLSKPRSKKLYGTSFNYS